MSLPHRNVVKKNESFLLDNNRKYNNIPNFKPNGLWYQIQNSLFEWGELYWGNYIYKLSLHERARMCTITNYTELQEFNDKYSLICKAEDEDEGEYKNKNFEIIDWAKVAEDYDGFEVDNYNNIKKVLDKLAKYENITWFRTIDFSSGCIWNLDIIEQLEYCKKVNVVSEENI